MIYDDTLSFIGCTYYLLGKDGSSLYELQDGISVAYPNVSHSFVHLLSVIADILLLQACHTNKSFQIVCICTVPKCTMNFKGKLLFSFQSDEQREETAATAQCYSF